MIRPKKELTFSQRIAQTGRMGAENYILAKAELILLDVPPDDLEAGTMYVYAHFSSPRGRRDGDVADLWAKKLPSTLPYWKKVAAECEVYDQTSHPFQTKEWAKRVIELRAKADEAARHLRYAMYVGYDPTPMEIETFVIDPDDAALLNKGEGGELTLSPLNPDGTPVQEKTIQAIGRTITVIKVEE